MYQSQRGHQCFLIALEGADMVGKATQARMLEDALRGAGYRATTEEVPYRDDLTHEMLYAMLRDGSAARHPDVFQALHCVNRTAFWRNYLPVLGRHHDVLVLDRWTLSTTVYGEAGGASADATEGLLRSVGEPDLTFVLDAPPWPKGSLDSLESDSSFQERVRALYVEHCDREPERFVKIDASRSREEVHADIARHVLGDERLQALRRAAKPRR